MNGEAEMMKCVHRQLSVGDGLPNGASQDDQVVDVDPTTEGPDDGDTGAPE